MKINLTNKLFQNAIPVLDIIENKGHEAYFVGGCVRDTLMHRPIHDIDIASSATPQEIQNLFRKTVDVGIEHGTVIVIYNDQPYEITTFRSEGDYTDHRRPDQVNFVRSLKEDTLRRDFTMNAMAIDQHGKVYDFHGGHDDIQQEQIRAVGIPYERFTEDALRMVRAIRFACQLGFKIEHTTFQAMVQLSPTIAFLSVERLKEEWTKILKGKYFTDHVNTIIDSHVIDEFPCFDQFDVKEALIAYEKFMKKVAGYDIKSTNIVWAYFMFFAKMDLTSIKKLLKKWTFSNRQMDVILQMIQNFTYLSDDQVLSVTDIYHLSDEVVKDMTWLHQILYPESCNNLQDLKQSLPIQNKNDIALNGQDIIELLALDKGGPIVGKILSDVEEKILYKQLPNDKVILKNYILNQVWEG